MNKIIKLQHADKNNNPPLDAASLEHFAFVSRVLLVLGWMLLIGGMALILVSALEFLSLAPGVWLFFVGLSAIVISNLLCIKDIRGI